MRKYASASVDIGKRWHYELDLVHNVMTKKSITSAYAHPKKSDDDKTVEDNSNEKFA